MTIEERKSRIIARGEFSDHAHVLTGDILSISPEGVVHVGPGGGTLRHIKESDWLRGIETWTEEHHDIPLDPGIHEMVGQMQFNPYTALVARVSD